MNPVKTLLVAAAALAAVATPLEAQVSPTPLRFTRYSITDPQMNGQEAGSFLLPAGWRAEGGVVWMNDFAVLANLRMRVSDPVSGACLEFLPLQNFIHNTQQIVYMAPGTNYLGCILHPPLEPVPFVTAFFLPDALRHLQAGRMVGAQDLPAVANELGRTLGGQGQARAARIRYQVPGPGGTWEEDVYVTLVYVGAPTGVIWSNPTSYSFRAPQGVLDRMTPTMAAMVGSFRVGQDWFAGYSYVQELFRNRMNQGIANARAISDTVTRNSEEIRRMYSDSYRQKQASDDRISRSFSEAIRGVESWRDPVQGREVQLPSGYTDAWVNNRGEYLLSPQAGFDPNPGSDSTWTRLGRPGQ